MASIHIKEIQKLLAKRGAEDAKPHSRGYFLEILFDEPGQAKETVDETFSNRTITADCPYGVVTIQFDETGQLKSIDLS